MGAGFLSGGQTQPREAPAKWAVENMGPKGRNEGRWERRERKKIQTCLA